VMPGFYLNIAPIILFLLNLIVTSKFNLLFISRMMQFFCNKEFFFVRSQNNILDICHYLFIPENRFFRELQKMDLKADGI